MCEVIGQGFDELPSENKTPYFFVDVVPRGMVDLQNPDGALITCPDFQRQALLWINKKNVERTIARLRSLGWNGTSFLELQPSGGFSFVGQEVELVCEHDEKDGRVYDRFSFPINSVPKPSDSNSDVARKMDTLYAKALQTTLPASTPVAAAQEPRATTEVPVEEPAEPVAVAADGSVDADSIPF